MLKLSCDIVPEVARGQGAEVEKSLHGMGEGQDTISLLKITKGNNSAKNVGGVTVSSLQVVKSCFIFVPSFVKLSQTVSKI